LFAPVGKDLARLPSPRCFQGDVHACPHPDGRTLLTFDNDTPYDEEVPSFTSPDRDDLEFCGVDMPHSVVSIYSYFGTHYSNALFASYDFGMKLGALIDSLEMSFGGDTPSRVSTNAEAVLTLFLCTEQVGEQRVPVNSNELVDQIGADGIVLNRATLQYVDATDEDAAYTSVVIDNVRVGQPVDGAENPATTCKNPTPVDPVDPEPVDPEPVDPEPGDAGVHDRGHEPGGHAGRHEG
jgi:hypothetical protein